MIVGVDQDVLGRIEPDKPDSVGGHEKLGVDVPAATLGIFIPSDNLREERFRQVACLPYVVLVVCTVLATRGSQPRAQAGRRPERARKKWRTAISDRSNGGYSTG